MATGLFVGIWVSRYLGPERFGMFSYAIAFSAIFSSIAKLGLDGIVVRDLVREPNQRDLYLGTAFWLKLGGAIVTLAVIAFIVLFSSNDSTTNLYIFIIASGTIFQSFEVVDFYFQSRVLSKFVSICKLLQLMLSSLIKLYLIFTGADLIWFVLVSLFDQISLGVSLSVAYQYQKIGKFYSHFNLTTAKQLLTNSWPLIFGGFILMVQARIDQVMLKVMIGNVELGYYSAAMRLIEAFCFIPIILTNSVLPAIVNAKKKSVYLYRARLNNLYRLMMILFIIVAVPIYFFGDDIIIFLYGDAYAPAGSILTLLAIRLIFTNYGVVRSAYLMTENLMMYSMLSVLIGTLINLLLNYIWIPSYHSIGAIWAANMSFMMSTFIIDFLYYKTRSNFYIMIKSMFLLNFKEK